MTKSKSRAVTTVGFDMGALRERYPHTPADSSATLDDFFEDMFSKGYELVTFAFRDATRGFAVFKVSGK